MPGTLIRRRQEPPRPLHRRDARGPTTAGRDPAAWHVLRCSRPGDMATFSDTVARVCVLFASAAAISRVPGRVSALIGCEQERAEVRLHDGEIAIVSSSFRLGNRILAALNAQVPTWHQDCLLERAPQVEVIRHRGASR